MKTDTENELSRRKHPRLDNYDYGSAGAYFVTICTQNRRCVLSRIVGRGLAPAEASGMEYTSFGKIAEQQQDGGSKPPPYDHRYRLYIFIEQKTPADLEKSTGVFYLFTVEQIYAV